MASNLDEKDFIQEKSSKFIWIFLVIFILISILIWGLGIWQHAIVKDKRDEFAFYRVTNREFSLFLWQNPQYMSLNVDLEYGYLPHYATDKAQLMPQYADMYVIAPEHILFRYHIWNRLLGKTLATRPIFAREFYEFLTENREWLPDYWSEAPAEYKSLVEQLPQLGESEIQEELPFEVRFAFQGWKNYFKEWEQIEGVDPELQEMEAFLSKHPHYNRSYWRNLVMEEIPDYLISFKQGPQTQIEKPEREIGQDELSNFLKIGYYNYSTL